MNIKLFNKLLSLIFFFCSTTLQAANTNQSLNPAMLGQILLNQSQQNSTQIQEKGTIQNPKMPIQPTVENKKKDIIKKTPNKQHIYKVKLALQFQDAFEGTISLPNLELKIKTKSHNYIFERTIKLKDIQKIEIQEWSALSTNDKKTYHFLPTLYKITTCNNTELYYHHNILALNKLKFNNKLGKTSVFSYFIDYTHKQHWLNLKKKSSIQKIQKPLTDVLTGITFITDKNVQANNK